MKNSKFLHVGCGQKRKEQTTPVFNSDKWTEVTLDIDPKCKPDIIASMTDMSIVEDNSFNAIYSSHNIEHLYLHQAVEVAKSFLRILKDDGYVMICCPDLKSVCKAVLEKGLLAPLYYLPNKDGVIDKKIYVSAIDILYGWRLPIQEGNHYMAHNTGFTEDVLSNLFIQAGFKKTFSTTRENFFDIQLLAFKEDSIEHSEAELLLNRHCSK